MDTAPIPPQPQIGNNRPKIARISVLFALLTLILGLALGFGANRVLTKSNSLAQSQAIRGQVEQKLPASIEILQNPLITEWTGHVQGQLTEKKADSFTLENKGSKLTIDIHKLFTGFYSATDSSKITPDNITYGQIPIGSYLQGNITIEPKNTAGLGGKYIVGNIFYVIKLPSK